MMSRTLALAALSLVLLSAGIAAMMIGVESWFVEGDQTVASEGEWQTWVERRMWVQTLAQAGAPAVAAGVIAGVGALALVVRARAVRRTQEG
jgi:hypothetical protein